LSKQINTLRFHGQLNYFKWSSVIFQKNLPKWIIDKLNKDKNKMKENDFIWIASGSKANCVRFVISIDSHISDQNRFLASSSRPNPGILCRCNRK